MNEAEEITVHLRLFAAAKQLAETDRLELSIPIGSKVADLRQVIIQEHPELSQLMDSAMFAIGNDYAEDDRQLHEDTEVACIPPVSGG